MLDMKLFNNYILKIICIGIFINGFMTYSQIEGDTLITKSFDELLNLYGKQKKFKGAEDIIEVHIKKAKKENNIEKLLFGYELAAILYREDEKTLWYCDSILFISKKNKKFNKFTANAYIKKGIFYNKKRDFQEELKNYLKAKNYIDETNNSVLNFHNNYNIGLIKSRLKEHREALKIHLKDLPFAKKEIKKKYPNSYLNTIYAIANNYIYLKQLDSATYYNTFGFNETTSLGLESERNFFVMNQGITYYYDKIYELAIDSLKKASSYFKSIKDFPNTAESYFYLGQSYMKVNDEIKAMDSFKEVDTTFQRNNDISPVVRESYNYLITYYRKKNDLYSALNYKDQLDKIDNIIHSNELYLNKNLIKDYDIPNLLSENTTSINEKNRTIIYGLLLFLMVSTTAAYYQYNKRKTYKKRFEEIITQKGDISTIKPVKKNGVEKETIPQELVDQILLSLEKFEFNKGYLQHNLTLQSLAKKINSNTAYLSKVVNFYKGSTFSNYINTLRVNYAVEQIQKNPVFKKYTIKAIASEVGFGNSESFSKAFFKSKGIKPSYFLRSLEKMEGKHNRHL